MGEQKDNSEGNRHRIAGARAIGFLLVLLSGMVASAREQPPEVSPPKPVVLPVPSVKELPNGVRLVVVERRSLPILTLRLLIQSGAESDPENLSGTAQLTAQLLTQGTKSRDASTIAESVDAMGAHLNAGAGWDHSYVELTVLSNQTDSAFEMLADVVQHPSFLPEEIERKRQQTISSLDILRDDPEYMADAVFNVLVSAGTPYGRPLDGTVDTVRKITRHDLGEFHRRNYRPGNCIIAAVGDISEEEALARVERFFGQWQTVPTEVPITKVIPTSNQKRRIVIVDKPDAVQTEIRVGNPGAQRASGDYHALTIANQILGGPAANRLFRQLRSRMGLAYGASSDLGFKELGGTWVAKTSTRTRETARSLNAVLDEIGRLRSSDVSPQDMQAAKTYLVGHMALDFETSEDIADQTLELIEHRLPMDYWNSFPARIGALEAPDISAVARRYLQDDRQVIVLVGNARQFTQEVGKLGPVLLIPLKDLDLASPTLLRPAK